ncbi:MAG: uroporphyrinogen-III synthase [Burkholderiaceae bacterium]
MQLLLTRPRAQAEAWLARLRAQGVSAEMLPLIAIGAPADGAPLRDAWARLADTGFVMFVSANAVSGFFAARPAGAAWPALTLAGCTGPGTSAALREQGVPPACIAEPPREGAQFDSEALWRGIAARPWAGVRALVVRGEDGRDWLAEQLRAAGAEVRFVEAYRRVQPSLSPPERALLRAAIDAPAASVWLFSSSQAVQHLQQLAPGADWSRATAWATHARIAGAARAAGFGAVITLAPTLEAVLAQWRRTLQSPATPAQRP